MPDPDVTHWERPRLCGGFKSYYGGLRTVRWAGDGHYVPAAGESDLVEVWAVPEGRYCAAGGWSRELGDVRVRGRARA